jgi:hypothetical protein
VTPGSDEPTAQAQAIMERVLGLVTECRLVLRPLEHPPINGTVTGDVFRFKQTGGVDVGVNGEVTVTGDEMTGWVRWAVGRSRQGARICARPMLHIDTLRRRRRVTLALPSIPASVKS